MNANGDEIVLVILTIFATVQFIGIIITFILLTIYFTGKIKLLQQQIGSLALNLNDMRCDMAGSRLELNRDGEIIELAFLPCIML